MQRTRNLVISSCFLFLGLALGLVTGCAQTQNSGSQSVPPLAQAVSPAENHKSTDKPIENPPATGEPASTKDDQIVNSKQPRPKTTTFPVIYYHSIKILPKNELGMPPEAFEKQIAYLSKQGYHSVSTSQLYDYYSNKASLPTRPIMITFDDGYMDNYTTALPILKKYGFSATLFLIVNKVGDRNCLTWKEVKELDKEGWDIQSHTLTHPDLTTLSPQTLQQELVDSKTTLEKELGKPVHFFAYPSGKHNDAVLKAVKDAGYLMAFSTLKGWTSEKMNPLLVHRVYCYASMGITEFSQRVSNSNY